MWLFELNDFLNVVHSLPSSFRQNQKNFARPAILYCPFQKKRTDYSTLLLEKLTCPLNNIHIFYD